MHTRGVRGGSFLLVVMAFAVIAAAAFAAPGQRLVLSGAFHTTSARTDIGESPSCGFRADHSLIYSGAAMRIGRSSEVARIGFVVSDYRRPGRYNAAARYHSTAASDYQPTAVDVTTADNAAKGVASGRYLATSGSLRVVQAKNVGRRGHWASLSGTVHADLHLRGTPRRLRLDGTWQCRIEPVANGVR